MAIGFEQLQQILASVPESTGGGKAGARNMLDVGGVDLPEFGRSSDEWGDWPFRFKQGIRAASLEAYMPLVYSEANDVLPNEEGLRAGE